MENFREWLYLQEFGLPDWVGTIQRLAVKAVKHGFSTAGSFLTRHKDSISGALFAASGISAFSSPAASAGFSIAGGLLPVLIEVLKDLEKHFSNDEDFNDLNQALKQITTT